MTKRPKAGGRYYRDAATGALKPAVEAESAPVEAEVDASDPPHDAEGVTPPEVNPAPAAQSRPSKKRI